LCQRRRPAKLARRGGPGQERVRSSEMLASEDPRGGKGLIRGNLERIKTKYCAEVKFARQVEAQTKLFLGYDKKGGSKTWAWQVQGFISYVRVACDIAAG
jgi:hypothetical protein